MSLGKRILRLARHRLADGLRGVSAAHRDHAARSELEAYLHAPPAGPRSPAAGAEAGPSAEARRPGPPPAGEGAGSRRPGPDPHPYAAEYRLLGLAPGADWAAVRRAWRARVRENHPDRFAGDAVAEQVASERLRAINSAFQTLKGHLGQL